MRIQKMAIKTPRLVALMVTVGTVWCVRMAAVHTYMEAPRKAVEKRHLTVSRADTKRG